MLIYGLCQGMSVIELSWFKIAFITFSFENSNLERKWASPMVILECEQFQTNLREVQSVFLK